MMDILQKAFGPAAMSRLTLVLNHVLSREPAACERLEPHAGAWVQVLPERWPALLPALPPVAFRITPAGLLEWGGTPPSTEAGLRIALDASNPLALLFDGLSGRKPAVRIDGDSRLAADVDWVIANVRWDIADDLQRLFGPGPAQALSTAGATLARGLSAALQAARGLGDSLQRGMR